MSMIIKRKLASLFDSADAMRRGAINFSEGEVEITLTTEELNQASSIVERLYLEEDAQHQIFTFAGYHENSEAENEDNAKACEKFMEEYSVDLCGLAYGSSEEGQRIRNEIIQKYEHDMDCDSTENVVWDWAIRSVLEVVGAEKRIQRLGWTQEDVDARRKRYFDICKILDDREYQSEDEQTSLIAEKDELYQTLGPKLWR